MILSDLSLLFEIYSDFKCSSLLNYKLQINLDLTYVLDISDSASFFMVNVMIINSEKV